MGRNDHELFAEEVADRLRANDLSVISLRHSVEFEEQVRLHPADERHAPAVRVADQCLYLIGIYFEERDLLRAHPECRDYRQRVPLLPRLKAKTVERVNEEAA